MAHILLKEVYSNAIIDIGDMTITEFSDDDVKVYSIMETLERWGGVLGVTLTIERKEDVIQYNDE